MKKNEKSNKLPLLVIIIALIAGFILCICSALLILLITRAMGNMESVQPALSNDYLPNHTCPQGVLQSGDSTVAVVNGKVLKMYTDQYVWVVSNCTLQKL